MVKVSRDMYLLRFMYDKYKYEFVTYHDLLKDIGWTQLQLTKAVNSLQSWGFFGDQRYGELRDDKTRVGTGYCLDSKYATEYSFTRLYKLEEMSV